MKIKSRLIALLTTMCICCSCITTTAFAAETKNPAPELTTENIQDIPDDAVILYQGDDGIIYQSKEKSSTYSTRSSLEYNDAYVTKDTFSNFTVKNPSMFGTNYGTLRVESSSANSYANIQFCFSNRILSGRVYASNGDLYFSFSTTASECTVRYEAIPGGSSAMRICCWLYTDEPDNYASLPKFVGNIAP